MDWDGVLRDLGPRLYRYFLGTFAPDLAEELVQEVLVRVVRGWKAGSFDASRGTLAMWAYGVAHNVRKETLRLFSREAGFLKLAEEPVVGEGADLHDIAVLRRAISTLPETEREVVLLHIDEGFSLTEIALLVDMPVGTVKSHIHRAKEKLRKLLGESREELL